MCGIFALQNVTDEAVATALDILKPRGRDGQQTRKVIVGESTLVLGHTLHAMVGHVAQPLLDAHGNVLVANCEIYNWQELNEKYSANASNDAELLLYVLGKKGIDVLEELDGVYAFVYATNEQLIVARDIIGVKPLWYSRDGCFASEAKVLKALGKEAIELSPQEVLTYTIAASTLELSQRNFIEATTKEGEPKQVVANLLTKAVRKRLSEKKTGILLSGGVDSTLLAKICQDLEADVTCYTAVFDNPDGEEAHDLLAAQEVAKRYGFKHTIIKITKEELPEIIKEVATQIETSDAVKVGVGIPFYVSAKKAAADGCKLLYSGLGAEELFAGYKRHKDATDINAECIAGLKGMHERDLYRDDVLTMRQGVELRLPFLDKALIGHALSLPAECKIHDGVQKYVLRQAAQLLGLEEVDAFRPKKAAQYGSKFDRALKRLADKERLTRVEYIQKLLNN